MPRSSGLKIRCFDAWTRTGEGQGVEGRRPHSKNLQVIEVAEACGTVRQHRTGNRAPGGGVRERPFGDFLQDVIFILGISGSVRVATKHRRKSRRPYVRANFLIELPSRFTCDRSAPSRPSLPAGHKPSRRE